MAPDQAAAAPARPAPPVTTALFVDLPGGGRHSDRRGGARRRSHHTWLGGGNPLRAHRHRRDAPGPGRHGRARRRSRRQGDRGDRPAGGSGEPSERAVVAHARRALEAAGISAVLTRTDDYRIGIARRAAIVVAVKPKAVVSVHHNASSSRLLDEPGTEVFHQAVGASAAESADSPGSSTRRWRPRSPTTRWRNGRPRRGRASSPAATPKVTTTTGSSAGRRGPRRPAGGRIPLLQGGGAALRPVGGAEGGGEAVARGVVRFLTTSDPGSGFISPPRLADDAPGRRRHRKLRGPSARLS